MSPRQERLYIIFPRKITAGILLSFFLNFCVLSSSPLAAQSTGGMKAPANLNSSAFKKNMEQLFIPEKSGFVTEVFIPKSNVQKMVFVMQDPHTNIKAQFNEADIYEHLEKEHKELFSGGNPLIALEGTPDTQLNYSPLTALPEDPGQEEVADFLVYEGKLNGSEYYKVHYNPAAEITGIESMNLYTENVMAFKKAREMKNQMSFSLRELRKAVNELKTRVYSFFLKKLDETISSFDSHPDRIKEHFASLEGLAKVKNIKLDEYPSYATMKKLMDGENKIQKNVLRDELATLGVFQIPFTFESRQAGRKFANQIEEALARAPEGSQKYFETRHYLDYLNDTFSIDAESFFGDLEKIYSKMFEVFSEAKRERDTAERDRALRLLEKMWELEVTDEEYLYYKSRRDELTDPAYWKALNKYFNDFLIDYRVKDNIYEVTLVLKESEKFYESAFARNEALFNNLMKQMSKRNVTSAFLVTGGFHARGISELFRKNNIAYTLIVPQIDLEQDSSLYWKTLSGETMSLEKIIRFYTTMPMSGFMEGSPTGTYSALLRYARLAAEDSDKAKAYAAEQDAEIGKALATAQLTDQGVQFSFQNAQGDSITLNVMTQITNEEEVRDLLKAQPNDLLRAAHPIRAGPDAGKFLFVNIVSSAPMQAMPSRITPAAANEIARVLGGEIIPGSVTASSLNLQQNQNIFNVQVFSTDQSAEFRAALSQNKDNARTGQIAVVTEGIPQTLNLLMTPVLVGDNFKDIDREIENGIQIAAAPGLSRDEAQSIIDQIRGQLPQTVNAQSLGKLMDSPIVLVEKLGEGGFGTVYKVTNTNGQIYALKVSNLELTEDRMQKWTREALLQKTVSDNPNTANDVPKYIDHGFLSELTINGKTMKNVAYLAMELLEGQTLEGRFVEERTWRPKFQENPSLIENVRIMKKAVDALAALHAQGIIHRDIKTENLFITKNGEVKILDLGLALEKGSEDYETARKSPALTGSVTFMAPEALFLSQDGTKAINEKTDIFSLGATFYRMLTGSLIADFEDTNNIVGSIKNLSKNTNHTNFDKFKEGILEKLKDYGIEIALPDSLIAVLHKSLAADPDGRYSSAEEFSKELQKVLDDIQSELKYSPTIFDVKITDKKNEQPEKITDEAAFMKTEAPGADSPSELKTRVQESPSLFAPQPVSQKPSFSIPLESSEDMDISRLSRTQSLEDFEFVFKNSSSIDGKSLGSLTLDKTVPLEHLGAGAFAVVTKAKMTNGQFYALKMPSERALRTFSTPAEAAQHDKDLLERYKKDIQILKQAQLSSNVVRYYGLSMLKINDKDGRERTVPVIVTELLDNGQTLDKKYPTKSTPPSYSQVSLTERIMDIHSIARALQDYHEKTGQINTDIKEANLFLADNGKVTFFDLNIAYKKSDVIDPADPFSTGTVNSGSVRGTPLILSPEMTLGAAVADQRHDIFSTGVVGFNILTGKYPHAHNLRRPGIDAATRNFAISRLKPSDFLDVDTALGQSGFPTGVVPKRVQDILAKAYHPDVNQRYQTAKQFADELESALVDFMIQESVSYLLGKQIPDNKFFQEYHTIQDLETFRDRFEEILYLSGASKEKVVSPQMQGVINLAFASLLKQETGLLDVRTAEQQFRQVTGRSLGEQGNYPLQPASDVYDSNLSGAAFNPQNEAEVKSVFEKEGIDTSFAPSMAVMGRSLGLFQAGIVEKKELGRGAFGRAFLAESQNNKYVVKQLLSREDPFAVQTLEREVDVLKKMKEAGVKSVPGFVDEHRVAVLDDQGMEVGTAVELYAMDFVPGKDIASVVDERGFEGKSAEDIFDSLHDFFEIFGVKSAQALTEFQLTSVGVDQNGEDIFPVHNDIKPANMLLTNDGRVIILDMGLVTYSNEKPADLYGTPLFMSPEKMGLLRTFKEKDKQAEYKRMFGAPSQEADIYALGVSLYNALTGQYPYDGARPDAQGDYYKSLLNDMKDVFDGNKNLIPPSEHMARRGVILPDDIAQQIDKTVLRMIDPDYFQRTDNSAQLESEAQNIIDLLNENRGRILNSIRDAALRQQRFELIDEEEEGQAIDLDNLDKIDLNKGGVWRVPDEIRNVKSEDFAAPKTALIEKIRGFLNRIKEAIFGKPDQFLLDASAEQQVEAVNQLLDQLVGEPGVDGKSLGQVIYHEFTGIDVGQVSDGARPLPVNAVNPAFPMILNEFVMRSVYGEFPTAADMSREFSGRVVPSLQVSSGIAAVNPKISAESEVQTDALPANVDPRALAIAEGISAFQGNNPGVVLVRFDPELLNRLTAAESKTAFDSEKAGIVLLIEDSKTYKEVKANLPPSAEEKGIMVVLYPKLAQIEAAEGLGNLSQADVQNVITRRAGNLVQRLLSNANASELNLENVALVSSAFSDKAGNESKRLRYDAEKFAKNPEYAAAHALASAYLALGLNPDGVFEKDPETGEYTLSESVLTGLVQIMKAKRLVAVMA